MLVKSDKVNKGEIIKKVKEIIKDLPTSDSDEAIEVIEGETQEKMAKRIKRSERRRQKIKMVKQLIQDLSNSSDSDKSKSRERMDRLKMFERQLVGNSEFKKILAEFVQMYPQMHELRIREYLKPMFVKHSPELIKEKFEKKFNKKMAKYELEIQNYPLYTSLKAIFTEKEYSDFFLMRMIKKFGKLPFEELCRKVNTYHKDKFKSASDPAKKKQFKELLDELLSRYPQFHKLRFIALLKKYAHHDFETAKAKIVKKLEAKLKKFELNDKEKLLAETVRKSCPKWDLYPMSKAIKRAIKRNPETKSEDIVKFRKEELKRLAMFK